MQKTTGLVYDKARGETEVDKARKTQFTQMSKQYDVIPPTEASRKQHSRQVVYQAGYVWSQALKPIMQLPLSSEWC